ncbi:MAG: Sir2 family NAD-dependent protein deacetylase [Alphaproteobacteria bacterium]|nr:Sir2 family NAD-dependent protein deacetylase [Alphaproteobacteria bacterium]
MIRTGQQDGIAKLRELLAESRRAMVFTGAGISTESGIPDFRSPSGLWTRMKPIQFQDFVRSREIRREAWTRRFEGEDTIAKAEPNAGHRAIARLVVTGKVSLVVTQNIDGLHQQGGVPEDKVVEVHGTTRYCKCLSCGLRYENDVVKRMWAETGDAPDCTSCGGIIKSATISFGQAMPEAEMERATMEAYECDLMLAVGSSLVVYPAAGIPIAAKRNGARLVILNREETELDSLADLVINAEIGPVLSAAVGVN